MSVQTTIPFPIRKKSSFYGNSKDNTPTLDFSNASLRDTPTSRYTPRVKKIVDISSSESESDSDAENNKNNSITKTPTRRKQSTKGKTFFFLPVFSHFAPGGNV